MSIQGSTSSSGTTGGGTAGGAQDRAHQAAGAAQEKAQQVAGQARGQVREQIDQRSSQAGEQVVSAALDVRKVGDTLRQQGQDRPAQWADQVAQRVESFGEYLRNSDGDRILHDVEDFGRRQPTAVIGGGVLLGLLASRFLKASSSRRYEARSTGTSAYPPRSRTQYPSYGTSGARDYTPGTPGAAPTEGVIPGSSRVERSDDLRDPSPGTPARDVSLTGGVLPDDPRRDPDFR